MYSSQITAKDIIRRLENGLIDGAKHEAPLPGLNTEPTPAAVLLPLFRQNREWRLLFIRRALNRADRHSGEVAFPGGRVESSDPHPVDTALRESREEIGLDPHHVQTLGRLPSFRTSSNYLVTPVVAQIPWPVELSPDGREVARIFSMPLDWLADSDNHEKQNWRPPGLNTTRQVIVFRDFEGERLWGVSARITLNLLSALS